MNLKLQDKLWLECVCWWFTDASNLSGYMCTDGRACPVSRPFSLVSFRACYIHIIKPRHYSWRRHPVASLQDATLCLVSCWNMELLVSSTHHKLIWEGRHKHRRALDEAIRGTTWIELHNWLKTIWQQIRLITGIFVFNCRKEEKIWLLALNPGRDERPV